MQHKESYAHKFAKETVSSWFKEKWQENKLKQLKNSYFIFEWQPDVLDEQHGMLLEYPILSRKLIDGTREILGVTAIWDKYPDLENLASDLRVEAVLDIGICSNGKLVYGLEIVHKHPCTPKKLVFIKQMQMKYGLKVYEINASWVLDQIRRPSCIEMTDIS